MNLIICNQKLYCELSLEMFFIIEIVAMKCAMLQSEAIVSQLQFWRLHLNALNEMDTWLMTKELKTGWLGDDQLKQTGKIQ